MVGPILGGSSDVALSADVAPLSDGHFDGCDLLQRSVVPYGPCKALATITIAGARRKMGLIRAVTRVALLLGPQSADRSVMHSKRPGDIR